MAGALAEFERSLILGRTNAGLAAAWARGQVGGRRPRLTPDQIRMAHPLMDNPETTTQQVADALHVSRATLYRALNRVRSLIP